MLGFNPISGAPISGRRQSATGGGGAIAYSLSGTAGTYALSGVAAGLKVGRRLSGSLGAYTLTGNAATLLLGRKLPGTLGAYTLTGQAATFKANRFLSGSAGTYTLTGRAAALVTGRKLSGTAGTYSLSGIAATLSYTPGAGSIPYSLSGTAGSYSLSGIAAGLKVGRLLSGAAGAYALSGNPATFTYTPGSASVAYSLSGDAGVYTLTGRDATFTRTGVDPFIAVITGYVTRRRKQLEEQQKRAEELAFAISEQEDVAPVRKPKVIPLAQLIGSDAAAQIQGKPGDLIDAAYQRQAVDRELKQKARRKADDEALLMMF